jgi:hemerythrin-like metal-binding domain
MIVWDETMSTGNDRTDSQHQTLIEKFNELSDVFNGSNAGEIRLAAGELLDFLQFYAAWHFQQEEALMEQVQCPAAEANKQAHAEFLAKFGEFYTRWQISTMSLDMARQTYAALAEWIVDHIMTVDVQMRGCVKE